MTAKEAFQNLFLDVWKRDEEINEKQLIVLKALTELEELKRDVARYFNDTELEGKEYDELYDKLMKVGK